MEKQPPIELDSLGWWGTTPKERNPIAKNLVFFPFVRQRYSTGERKVVFRICEE